MADLVVICCGSRALADDPAAVRWAREILSRELASASLVVAGDACGPDGIATDFAANRGKRVETWSKFGTVLTLRGVDRRWTTDPLPDSPASWRSRLLARNAAMVAYYAGRENVRMVALRHAASTTHDTTHTVGLARAAGIDVSDWTWGAS